MKRLSIILFLLLSGCDRGDDSVLRVTGQIEGEAVTAGSRVGGRVTEVAVEEGERVEQGQVLIQLDPAEARAGVAAAEAQLSQARAALAKLTAGATIEQIEQARAALRAAQEQYEMAQTGARTGEKQAARATVDAAQAPFDNAKTELERAQRLLEREVISRQTFQQAQAAFEAAEAQLRSAREQADMVSEGPRAEEIAIAQANYERAKAFLVEVERGPREEDIAVAQAAVEAAEADVQRAQVALDEMTIVAPIGGIVESVDVKPGDLVKPGPAVRIVDPDDLEMVVYVSADMLGQIRLGQELPLTTDAHGDETFTGEIIHIATQGEYTPRNLQTEEERVQQVFGVRLAMDSAGGKLRAGMSSTAHLPREAPESP